ncbi:hypothetical protein OKA04_16605 [Luteolibacter flavescens]|uniref:O-antigen ligase domain-containing protein n=1 Tax=Luteolibacter flavescens TaxID=1859460 RepID=A0ABT3FRZ7_9BACT|nr:hypothetical protein [Luteolibacter flavescens]MCW1886361.1 hypothetical protein [Luteolibacter flavescens]
MSALGFLFFVVTAIALLSVPRKWALIPFLVGIIFMTHGQRFELGGVGLPIFRLLLMVGLGRIIMKGEGIEGGANAIDKLLIAFFGWMFFANFFHESGAEDAGPMFIIGVSAEIGICYLLVRCYCRTLEEFYAILAVLAYLLVPVALEMVQEEFTGKNLFSSVFGGVNEMVVMREGELRARGPFRHAILAGTVGAGLIPLMFAMWRRNPRASLTGMAACLTMVIACSSSGPILSLIFGILGMCLWWFRPWMGLIRWCIPLGYIFLEIMMKQPAYYIIAKLSRGGSTGWHRSRLIEAFMKHFGEWWLVGTDYTRGWMPTGLPGKHQHTDITNYFLAFGVKGGLLAVLLFVAIIWIAFKWVGDILNARPDLDPRDRFMIWCMGTSLFTHVASSVSVAYYDQSYVFFWFSIASISALAAMIHEPVEEAAEEEAEAPAEESSTGNTGGGYTYDMPRF